MTSRVSPYDTAPQFLERKTRYIDMMVRDQPEVTAYRFWGAPTLDAAYGAPTGSGMPGVGVTQAEAMFEVERSNQYRSPSIIRRGLAWYGENLRGMSRVAWDPNDFVTDPATSFPGDGETWFLRLQERRRTMGWLVVNGAVDTGEPKLGSIYVLPPPSFFGQPQPGLTLAGTAPAGTGAVVGSVPPISPDMQVPNPMHIVLPRWTVSCFVNNTGLNPLLCSSGWGLPMLEAGTNEDAIEFGGGIKELVLAGSGGTTTFDIYAVIAVGPGG